MPEGSEAGFHRHRTSVSKQWGGGPRPSIEFVSGRSPASEVDALLVQLQRLRQRAVTAEHRSWDALAVSRTVGSLEMAISLLEVGHGAGSLDTPMILDDAERLGVLLAPDAGGRPKPRDWLAAQDLAEGLWMRISRPSELQDESRADAQAAALAEIAKEYRNSADVEARAALRFTVAASAVASSAVALAALAVARGFESLNYYLGICVGLALAAALLWAQGTKSRTAAREWRRLATGVRGIEPYLAPMSAPMQDLMRGVMVQRLFPRLIEDDDPIREPRWPDATSMLTAISYGLAPQGEPGLAPEPIDRAPDVGSVHPDTEPLPGTPPA